MKTRVTLLLIALLVVLVFIALPKSDQQLEATTQGWVKEDNSQENPVALTEKSQGDIGSAAPSVLAGDPVTPEQTGTAATGSAIETILPGVVITGQILNETGSGLSDMEIVLRSVSSRSDNRQMYRTRSNELGEFEFAGVSAGHIYRLEVKPTSQFSGHVVEAIKASRALIHFDIQLSRLQRLDFEGLVTGFSGAPLPNVNLTVQNLSVDYDLTAVKSDSSGYFLLQNFPAGELKLFTAKPERLQISGVQLDENQAANFRLRFDHGSYHLQGWVIDQNGMPIDSARIILEAEFDYAGYHSSSKREALTNRYGEFEFLNLSEIDHRLTVFAPGKRSYKLNHRFTDYSDQLYVQIED